MQRHFLANRIVETFTPPFALKLTRLLRERTPDAVPVRFPKPSHCTQALLSLPLPDPVSNVATPSKPAKCEILRQYFLVNHALPKKQAKVTHKNGA
jgi:hypothetical protein